MKRTEFSRRPSAGRILSALAPLLLMLAMTVSAHAQIYPPHPCNNYWIDTWHIPAPVQVDINWGFPGPPGTQPTMNIVPGTGTFGPMTVSPMPPYPPTATGIPQTWSVTIAGVTYGPFPYPNDDWICDPFHHGKCMRFRSYYMESANPPCWHEFQVLSDLTCPDSIKCP